MLLSLFQSRLSVQYICRVMLHVLLEILFVPRIRAAKNAHVLSRYLFMRTHMSLQFNLAGILLLALRTRIRLMLPGIVGPNLSDAFLLDLLFVRGYEMFAVAQFFFSQLVASDVPFQVVRPRKGSPVPGATGKRATLGLVVPRTRRLLHFLGIAILARFLDLLISDRGQLR